MTTSTATRLLLAPALAAAIALAGCGQSSDAPGGTPGSSTATATTSLAPEAFLGRLQQAADDAGSVSMTMKGNVMQGNGAIRYGADRAATFTIDSEDSSTQVVLVDGVVYSKDTADSDARWQVMPPDQGAELVDGMSPEGTFLAMRSAATSVTSKGSEQVEGTPTTHYVLTLDPGSAGENAGVTPSPGTPDLVYDVWVGDDGLLRRISYSAGASTLVVDYLKWGEPVDVVAPPADQVDPTPTS